MDKIAKSPRTTATKRNSVAAFLTTLLLFFCALSLGCHTYDKEAPDEVSPDDLLYEFPKGFIWGAASSAYQTEGRRIPTDFDVWLENLKRIAGNFIQLPEDACNSYYLYELDAELVKNLGCNMYRIGIEWARVEPEPHEFDQAEIQHYRNVIKALVDRGIKPMVTLHHFTNPTWIHQGFKNGWEDEAIVDYFTEYVSVMASALGDLVDYWLTINEPVIYSMGVALTAGYPKGRILDFDMFFKITKHMALAHGYSYHIIKSLDTVDADGDGKAAIVSFAKAVQPPLPADPDSPDDVNAALAYDYYFHWLYLNAVTQGWIDTNGNGILDGKDEGIYPELINTLDFLGINYYAPARMKGVDIIPYLGGFPCILSLYMICKPKGVSELHGDNGNEVFPKGIIYAIDYARKLGVPAFITENGIATEDSYFRSWYVIEHLKQVHSAIKSGAEVLGYLYWTLMDNFEWLAGYSAKFGLFRVDRTTFERKWTLACDTYKDIITHNGITYKLAEDYSVPPNP